MNRSKLSFTNGCYRVIEFDPMIEHAPFTLFQKGDETVLTAVTANLVFFEPLPPETCAQEPRHDLFGARVR